MTWESGVKAWGNSQGISVPTEPKINPHDAPIITSDFNNILAWREIMHKLLLTEDKRKYLYKKAEMVAKNHL